MMGPGIAAILALAGHPTRLYGRGEDSLARGLSATNRIVDFLADKGVVSAAAAAHAHQDLSGTTDLAVAVGDAEVVFESIPEDMQLKQAFFERLEALTSATTLLVSNTSGLRISEIAARLERPERAVTTHFYMPPHLVPLVDVVKGERTSDETVSRIKTLLTAAGKRPVVVLKDTPGQLGIRMLQAVNREAFHIVREGIASAEDVDIAIKYGPGLRFPVYGPLEHADVVGLDLIESVASYVWPDLSTATAPDVLHALIAEGDLGVKSGRGFYDWSRKSADEVKAIRDAFLLQRLLEETRQVAESDTTD